MKKTVRAALAACFVFGCSQLSAGIMGVSTSVTGGVWFQGLGSDAYPADENIGAGWLRLGQCNYNEVEDKSSCETSGNYVESPGSDDPGNTGTFSLVQMFAGNFMTTVPGLIVRPQTVGSGSLVAIFLSPTTSLQLTLSGSQNTQLVLPPDIFQFTALAAPGTQQCFPFGDIVPASCTLPDVALVRGPILTSDIAQNGFSFNIPDEVRSVPAPSSLLLLGIGLAGLVRRRRHALRR